MKGFRIGLNWAGAAAPCHGDNGSRFTGCGPFQMRFANVAAVYDLKIECAAPLSL